MQKPGVAGRTCSALFSLAALILAGCGGPSSSSLLAPAIPGAVNDTRTSSQQTVVITLPVGEPADLTLRIVDGEGRQVRENSMKLSAGANEITWDGRSDSGQDAGNGVYFYVIEFSTGERYVGRLVLIR